MQLTTRFGDSQQGRQKAATHHQAITDTAGHVEEQQSKGEATRVIDESVASQMLNAMESSAEHYNTFVKVDGYRMAAKSGTAEVAGANGQLTSIISDYSTIIPADNHASSSPWCSKTPKQLRRFDGGSCHRGDW